MCTHEFFAYAYTTDDKPESAKRIMQDRMQGRFGFGSRVGQVGGPSRRHGALNPTLTIRIPTNESLPSPQVQGT